MCRHGCHSHVGLPRQRRWRIGRVAAFVALLGAFACPVNAQPARAPACADRPVFGWLDFWVGDWRVFVGEQQVGTNRVVKVLDGCAVTEEWTDARGSEGRSLFYVAPGSGQWRQVWVTDTALAPGGVKEKQLIARFPDGAVRFQGEIAAEGVVVLDRTTLTPLEDGRVRQVIERSDNGGETWQTGFDAVYVRVPGAGGRQVSDRVDEPYARDHLAPIQASTDHRPGPIMTRAAPATR